MNYWERWIGAWKKKTAALSFAEKGAYGEMLDYQYANDCAELPGDLETIYRVTGAQTSAERAAVNKILTHHYEKRDGQYFHARVQQELDKRARYEQGQRDRAMARWHPREQAKTATTRGNGEDKVDPLTQGAVVISIPLADGTDYEVHQGLADELTRLYPDVDTARTLAEVRGWNLAHPTKRKTARGIVAHLNTWFAKEQNA